ncbi:MAG: ABC transporter substrate-binding protein [Deltaproteobacteria bacterium]|nr:ABC transporter substrate-binding protein [Deltaproteobacteria bacterium]
MERIFLCCAFSLSVLLLSFSASAGTRALRIGLIAPISGDLAQYGVAALNGMKLANEQIEGVPAEIFLEDNPSCGPSDAVTAAQKLINIEKVDLLVTVCTGAAQGVLPIVKARSIPLFQLTESGPDPDKYMIKLMPDAVGLVDLLAERYAKRYPQIALIGATIQVNSGERGNLALFKSQFEALGGKVVFYEEFPSETLDFRSTIEKIRRSGARAVIPFLAPAQQLAAFLKQADELHLWKHTALAGNFFFEFMLKDLTASYPNLKTLDGLESSNLEQATSPQFLASYKKKYGSAAPQFADYAYDAMTIIKHCGLNTPCYRRPFDGVSGKVEFDKESDRRLGQVVLRVLRNGTFVDAPRE